MEISMCFKSLCLGAIGASVIWISILWFYVDSKTNENKTHDRFLG